MAKWVVIRVAAEDGVRAQSALALAFAPIDMTVDMYSLLPDWEIRVQGRTEREVRSVLGEMVRISRVVIDADSTTWLEGA